MNQYPIDLSISLGYIVQKEVTERRCIFSRDISSACFANQIMKYMTGISSNDCLLQHCVRVERYVRIERSPVSDSSILFLLPNERVGGLFDKP